MKIYLVRHAKPVKRSRWTEADRLRPLVERGERQASGLAALLQGEPLRRVYSSPELRCRQTVEGLAADHGLEVLLEPHLEAEPNEGGDLEAVLALLAETSRGPLVLCASRSWILEILGALGVGDGAPETLRCQKGSVWLVERRAGRLARAEYMAPTEEERGERCAVLDIGSTSMSLLVAEVGPGMDRIQPIHRSRAELRLGASAKGISGSDRGRILELGRSMRSEAEAAGCTDLTSVATASLRDAANGGEVAARLNEVLPSPVEVLSGREEAKIAYQAVCQRLDLADADTLVVDLGGGSLDLALGSGPTIHYAASEPLGATRLHADLVHDDPMTPAQRDAIRARVRERLAPHVERLGERHRLRCACAGGSGRALARMIQVERGKGEITSVRGVRLLRSDLQSLAKRLRRATHRERLSMPGIAAKRADLLPTAAIVLAELIALLELPDILVSDWGLREGVLLRRQEGA